MGEHFGRFRSFLRELKRRNVYRVAVAYVAVAFVGFQAANLLVPSTVLPVWTDEFFLALLIVGFPLAVVVAWAFELTPEGVRRTSTGADLESTAGGGGEPDTGGVGVSVSPEPRSVAVLPFVNVSPDPENEYLSDGITEELIGALGALGDLKVAARTSVFAYKGRQEDVRTIGRELGVESVLEGSVRRAGDRLRITAELVDTDGGYQLWSKSFDRTLEDVFQIQEEIAHGIVDRLRIRLLRPDAELMHHGTDDVSAYDEYLEGRYHLNRRTWRSLGRAVEAFGRAVEIDPGFARAHAGLADSHLLLERYGVASPGDSLPAAERSARRAVELDPSLPEGHVSLAYVHMIGTWNLDSALREFEEALELDPEHAPAHHWYAWCLAALGRQDQALSHLETARSLEPLSLIVRTNIGTVLYFARRFDEAAAQLEETLELDPAFPVAHQWLGRVHQAAGRLPQAVDAFQQVLDILGDDPETIASLGYALGRAGQRSEASELRDRLVELSHGERYVSPYWHGLVLLGLDDRDGGLEELERAFEVRFDWLLFLHVDPLFDPFRGDGRFDSVVREVERATIWPEG